MTPITIAHISDLHLSAEHRRNHIRRTKRALEYIRSLDVDHIVVTGDITANGEPADYRIARSIFASADLLDSRKLTVTIGNHDVFGGVHTAEDVLKFPKHCEATDDKAKVREFGYAFRETFESTLRPSEKRFFPFAKIVGDTALIGVNTVAEYSRFKNPVGSNGSVDDRSFEQLTELLESPLLHTKRKIVVLHHHFSKMQEVKSGTMHSVWNAIEKHTMKLRGKGRLLKLFARLDVAAVLHGHVHESNEYFRDGVRFLNAGGTVLHDRSPDIHVNIVRVSDAGVQTEIHRLSAQSLAFPADSSVPVMLPVHEAQHHAA
jgi:3',5'-cyclic AMP phosphodiesterase CpdA